MRLGLVVAIVIAGTIIQGVSAWTQNINPASAPDPKEIPIPPIKTVLGTMPGVKELPVRQDLPDVMLMNDGTTVTTPAQWRKRRDEMKRILEYYAVGIAPPPPGNVKGKEIKSQLVLSGRVKYRLIHLTFGPKESLSLDIGVFAPAEGGPFPALIMPSGTPPGGTSLPRLPPGPGQGTGIDALLAVGPDKPAPAPGPPGDAEAIASRSPALAHGFAFITFNNNDCGEDTTLRNADGGWAFRTTRFYPAYPSYDWGLLAGWAWGVSRIVDYLVTDAAIDKHKIIVSGVSRTGKSALVAGAFDDRIAMVAPVASSGGGTPAFRFSGAEHGGKEGLSEMMKKYPNWFSPHLHEFWGQPERLPFDQHWFIALAAPRPFIALEGTNDQNVNQNGVKQAWLAAQPAYGLFGATDRLGVNWTERPHGMVQGDWDALLAFADKFLLGKKLERRFDEFPGSAGGAGVPPVNHTQDERAAFQTATPGCARCK
jgi:Abhydrolase family